MCKWFHYRRSDLQETSIFWKIGRKAVHAKGRNTTNLFSYLKQKHTAEFGEAMKASEEKTTGDLQLIGKHDPTSLEGWLVALHMTGWANIVCRMHGLSVTG